MEVKLFILLTFAQYKWIYPACRSVSGKISEDIAFLHKMFSVPPPKRAIIEVNVSYPDSSRLQKDHFLTVGIYTTKDHVNIIKHCVDKDIGQFWNEYLHPRIAHHSRHLRCKVAHGNILYCSGNITVQDFIPRKFSFSFGFDCSNVDARDSLKGLFYNISISVTNETECFKLPFNNTCHRFLQYGVLHNLMGIEYERDEHLFWFDRFITVDVFRLLVHCYQYRHEFLCYVAVPKCDPVSIHVIHPCREMCQGAKIACGRVGFYKHLNCSTLPSKDENITCIYERMFCRAPPKVKNAGS